MVFAFYESYSIYGGNVASTLAGEFSYSWSFALSLVYLGLLIKGVRDDRKYLKWAALALALTALCHILTTLVVIFASLFVLIWEKGFVRTLLVWFWGFAMAGAGLVASFAVLTGGGAGELHYGDALMLAAVALCGLGYAEGAVLARRLGGWQVICWALVLAAPPMIGLALWRWPASFHAIAPSAWNQCFSAASAMRFASFR